jgi:hypothetical protein
MAVTLTLGGIVFQDFEVPERINFGGEQMLAVHKLPGGSRVIDAMGADDAEIRWSGRFRGPSAEERATLLDFMRRAGNQILLTWSFHRYQVVIREFTANFEQSYEIPYSIACTVLRDEIATIASATLSLIDAIASDLLSATGLAGTIGIPAINTAVTGVAAAFTNYQAGVPTQTNVVTAITAATEPALLGTLVSSIGVAQSATQSAIGTNTAALNTAGSVGGASAGVSPTSAATSLVAQSAAMSQLGLLYQLSSTLGRMNINAQNARS